MQILAGLIENNFFNSNITQWYHIQENKTRDFEGYSMHYIHCVFRTMRTLGGLGYRENVENHSISSMIYSSFLTILGRIISCICLAKILVKIRSLNSSTFKYEDLVNTMKKYVEHKRIPRVTEDKLNEFYNFKYSKNYYEEEKIMDCIPAQLKQDITMHTTRRLLKNVSFFANIPISILIKMVTCLHREIFLARDVVIKSGDQGDCMFFITTGTVSVFSPSMRELCQLEEGAHFGEIALIKKNQRRVATIIAVETCELLRWVWTFKFSFSRILITLYFFQIGQGRFL